MENSLPHRHVLGADNFTRDRLEALFAKAAGFQRQLQAGQIVEPLMRGRVMGSLFFEPSTRTRMSFETAFLRLGGSVNALGPAEYSSLQKGESFADTLRVIQHYADVLVIRHPEPGAVQQAAQWVTIPVINAGDGAGEHPTQAVLDWFTVWQKRPLDGLHLACIGDLRHSRTVHSLLRLLPLFEDVRLTLVSPPEYAVPEALLRRLQQGGVQVETETDWERGLGSGAHVFYVTRMQKERWSMQASEQATADAPYRIDKSLLQRHARPDAWVLHPLPRVDELAEDVDTWPGALYFEQAANGVCVRMALFAEILGAQL